jgi:hypothetical protein
LCSFRFAADALRPALELIFARWAASFFCSISCRFERSSASGESRSPPSPSIEIEVIVRVRRVTVIVPPGLVVVVIIGE